MDRYHQVQVLGRGSYGQAILVKERAGNRRFCVIKEIDISRMGPAAEKEAQTEADVLKSLHHPNIVAYFGTFVENRKLYIAMEFADGGDLSAEVKKRKSAGGLFAQDEALRLFVEACSALYSVHLKHILHRDLKCQNIFMTKSGVLKLGDFGIAKKLDSTADAAVTMIGTPVYLAPEVCESRPYGMKADIWSLGVVFYEMLALDQPFRAENVAALLMKILRAEPKPVPSKHYSEGVRSLLASLLQKKPEDRPSAEEILSQPVLRDAVALLPAENQVVRKHGKGDAGAREPSAHRKHRGTPESGGARQTPTPVADSLDALVGNRRDGGRPHDAQQRPPPVGSAAAEFHRNRELAAQARARAEGDGYGRGPSQPRSRSSDANAGAANARRESHDARRAAEEKHCQALQEAAMQARRDREQVKQRMMELDRPPDDGGDRRGDRRASHDADDDPKGEPSSAAQKRAAEAKHLEALREAGAQAWHERQQLRQRNKELEHGSPRHDVARHGSFDGESPSEGSGGRARAQQKKAAEAEHLQALQEAAAEARRDQQKMRDKMRALEERRGGGSDGAGAEPAALADGGPDAGCGHRRGEAPSREDAEAQHLQALQEASAQARRDQQQMKKKMQDLERAPAGESSCGPSRAVSRKNSVRDDAAAAEAQHVQALQEAAAQARRDQKQLRQKMQDLQRGSSVGGAWRDDGGNGDCREDLHVQDDAEEPQLRRRSAGPERDGHCPAGPAAGQADFDRTQPRPPRASSRSPLQVAGSLLAGGVSRPASAGSKAGDAHSADRSARFDQTSSLSISLEQTGPLSIGIRGGMEAAESLLLGSADEGEAAAAAAAPGLGDVCVFGADGPSAFRKCSSFSSNPLSAAPPAAGRGPAPADDRPAPPTGGRGPEPAADRAKAARPEGPAPCPGHLDLSECATLDSLTYTMTGTLSALSCLSTAV